MRNSSFSREAQPSAIHSSLHLFQALGYILQIRPKTETKCQPRMQHGLKVTNNGRKKSRNTNETLIHENCRLALETLTGLRNTERN